MARIVTSEAMLRKIVAETRATRREPVDGPAEDDVLWIETTMGDYWRACALLGRISADYLEMLKGFPSGSIAPSDEFIAEIAELET